MVLRIILFFTFICFTCGLKAQISPAAQKHFEQAIKYEAKKDRLKAKEEMEKAIKESPAYTDAYSLLGSWYFRDHNFAKSADVFKRASFSVKNGAKLFAFPLAKALVYSGDETAALQILNNQGAGTNTFEWNRLRDHAQFIQQSRGKAWKDTVHNMSWGINTPDPEMFPGVSSDERTLYLTRRRNNSDEDFYYAVMDTCDEWYSAANMGSPPNTPSQESAQTISADGHYLFFMQCENRSENGWGQGGCDLYMCYRADSIWSAPQSFGATINTPGYEGMPTLSPDNKELYFVSDRAGGSGGLDIWMSRFQNGLWQAPRNMGPAINTAGNETAPFLHIDNKTLYFASDAHPGFGGSDLFLSRRLNDTTWTKPANMGAPINSSSDEMSQCTNLEGSVLYFASDRDSVAGNFDLYRMTLPEPLRPFAVNVVKGFVYDSLSKNRLSYASIHVMDAVTDEELYQYSTNRGDGSFMLTLPAGGKYKWHIDRISFQDGDGVLDMDTVDIKAPLVYNIPLLPADYVAPIKDSLVLTVRFPLNGSVISDSARAVIREAMSPWLSYKEGLTIYVNGYTDNIGSPIINEQLSQARATLISKELTSLGFDPFNIHAEGWGEADAIEDNDTEEHMAVNRRVEVIIKR
jgi:outer membrane protein OmpA-like peptidoglycan-associated protein